MQARLLIAKSSLETGALLKEYLTERGLEIVKGGDHPIISYGVPTEGLHILNRLSGRGKIYNMERMNAYGIQTVPWFPGDKIPGGIQFPLLARKKHGYGGTDIVPVFQPDEIPWRIAAGWEWFSSYVPVDKEFRVWVFRNEVLGTYSKEMKRPEEFKFIGRNFRNGFDFMKVEDNPKASKAGLDVLKALKYDFAAVDMLLGLDGNIYVLETNSAPGAIASGAQETLGKLADRMAEWAMSGCPEWK
jgi:hypothetical protein